MKSSIILEDLDPERGVQVLRLTSPHRTNYASAYL
jgi:hypothetical protein